MKPTPHSRRDSIREDNDMKKECNCCCWDDAGYVHEPHCNLAKDKIDTTDKVMPFDNVGINSSQGV